MKPKIKMVILLFIFLFFLLFPQKVFAGDVVINEFLLDPDVSQWVELYNKGTDPIDVSGWFIDDSGGKQKYTIEPNTIIDQGEFKVFESTLFNLNRVTPDTVKLLNGSSLEDSYSYETGPGENNTYGRQTDGAGTFVIFDSPSKGSSNNTSSPSGQAPTPTSKPSTPEPKETVVASENNLLKILIGLGVIIITTSAVLAFRFYKRHE